MQQFIRALLFGVFFIFSQSIFSNYNQDLKNLEEIRDGLTIEAVQENIVRSKRSNFEYSIPATGRRKVFNHLQSGQYCSCYGVKRQRNDDYDYVIKIRKLDGNNGDKFLYKLENLEKFKKFYKKLGIALVYRYYQIYGRDYDKVLILLFPYFKEWDGNLKDKSFEKTKDAAIIARKMGMDLHDNKFTEKGKANWRIFVDDEGIEKLVPIDLGMFIPRIESFRSPLSKFRHSAIKLVGDNKNKCGYICYTLDEMMSPSYNSQKRKYRTRNRGKRAPSPKTYSPLSGRKRKREESGDLCDLRVSKKLKFS